MSLSLQNRESEVLFGPFGTALKDAGSKRGISDFDHPKYLIQEDGSGSAIERIARSYVEAGARIPVTPTYGASRRNAEGSFSLEDYRLAVSRGSQIIQSAVSGARGVRNPYVSFGSAGPTYSVDPHFDLGLAGDIYSGQFSVLKELGIDANILVEALSSAQDAVTAARVASRLQLPITLAVAVKDGGVLYDDTPVPELIRQVLAEIGGFNPNFSVAINCSTFADVRSAVDSLRENPDLRRFLQLVYPNASDGCIAELDESKSLDNGGYCIDHRAQELSVFAVENNLDVGGCCGTTARAVRKLVHALGNEKLRLAA